jgi:hypothetical protein
MEKSLQMAQKRGTKILLVPNPDDPLKSSNGKKIHTKGWICSTSASSYESWKPWTQKPSVA